MRGGGGVGGWGWGKQNHYAEDKRLVFIIVLKEESGGLYIPSTV